MTLQENQESQATLDVESALEFIRDTMVERDAKTEFARRQIANLSAKVKELEGPYNQVIDSMTKQVETTILREGKTYKGAAGTVAYKKGYDKVSWDDDKLQGYALEHPGILIFRRSTPVPPTATVKVSVDKVKE